METETHKKLNIVCQQIQILYRKLDRNEIIEEEYKLTLEKLTTQKKELQAQYYIEQEKETMERLSKMPEIEAKKEKKTVKTTSDAKPKKVSRVSVILDALQMKSVKSMEQAVDKVLEKLPADDKKHIASQISLTIAMVKKGKGSLAKYTWDEANFNLSVK